MKSWAELTIFVEFDKWSTLEGELYDREFYSFELIDPRIEQFDDKELRWDFIDEDMFQNAFEGITVKVYGEDYSEFQDLLENIEDKDLGSYTLKNIDDQDWKNNWKNFYSTMEIGKKITIKPTWEEYENLENRYLIELDPGMAFGTGGHETTKMCLEHLEKIVKAGDLVLDIGSGSGILAIAAKKLGAGQVIGTDLDEEAVIIARKNAKLNEVEAEFRVSNLFSNVNEVADLIVSNIVAEIIVLLLEDIGEHLKPGGYFISSGIIEEKSYLVEEALVEKKFFIIDKVTEGEWVSLVARFNNA